MTSFLPRALPAATVTAALLLGACAGGDDAPRQKPTSASPSGSPAPDRTGPTAIPAPSSSPSAPATAAEEREHARTEIVTSWKVLFSPRAALKQKLARVADGEQYALMVQAFAEDERAAELRAHVTGVTFRSATRADVEVTLTRGGRKAATGLEGTNVRQDDAWKISLGTLCELTHFGAGVPQAAACRESERTTPPASREQRGDAPSPAP